MATGTWKPITEPPKKDGRYMVKFYCKDRHATDRIDIVFRKFTDGAWAMPYLCFERDGSELYEWLDKED